MVIFWYPFCRQQQSGPGPNFEPYMDQKNMDQIDQMAQRWDGMDAKQQDQDIWVCLKIVYP